MRPEHAHAGRDGALDLAGLSVDPHAIAREHWRDTDAAGRWVCVACGQPWQGGGADGGCPTRLLALLAERWATDYFAMRDDCNALATRAAAEFNRAEALARRMIEQGEVLRDAYAGLWHYDVDLQARREYERADALNALLERINALLRVPQAGAGDAS